MVAKKGFEKNICERETMGNCGGIESGKMGSIGDFKGNCGGYKRGLRRKLAEKVTGNFYREARKCVRKKICGKN